MKILRRLRALLFKSTLDAEMAEEMRGHVEMETARHVAQGLPPDAARHAAQRSFGGVEQIKERVRDGRGWRWLDDIGRDFRFGVRMLVKAPVMSAVIVLSLAVGLGANTAVFSWIHTVALDPLPAVHDGPGLVLVEEHTASGIIQFASPAEWRYLRAQTTTLTGLFAHYLTTFNFAGKSADVRVWGEVVSANFFETLGVQPAAGRLLRPDDDEAGRPPVAVISYKLWQTQFGGRAAAIGESMRLNDRNFTIVGVAAEQFQGAVAALAFDVWLPQGRLWEQDDRRHRVFQMMGRLRPGASLRQANADVALVLGRLAKEFPDTTRGVSAEVIPHWRSRIGVQAILVPTLASLQTVTFLLLLVVCTNTANLLLAQATTRRKEIAIRLSLGAGRARVVRQLLTESLLLALGGVGLGTVLAFWGLDLINGIPKPTGLPIALTAHVDRAELVFSVLLAFVCALVFGLVPALQTTRGDVGTALKVGGRTSGAGGRRRFQEFLVGAEIALTLVIVILAGLFLKSFHHAREVNPGFEPEHVLLGSFDLGASGYSQERARVLPTALLARVKELPGVQSAAVATSVPLDLVFTVPSEFTLEGRSRAGEAPDHTLWYEVSRGYFEALQIGLVEGRDLVADPSNGRDAEAVVNEEFTRRFLTPGQTALGRRLTLHGVPHRIVGVVRTGKYNALNETPQPAVYLAFSGQWRSRVTLFVRTNAEPTAMFAAVKGVFREIDPGVAYLDNRTLVQHLNNAMVLRVIPAKLLSVLGPMALIMAAIGLYSVLAYTVAQRTHEIGVRMTLGATTRSVLLLILRQGMNAVVLGIAAGLVAAYFLSVRLSSQLVQVPPGDITLFAPLPLLLAAVALFACYLPARRAAKVDPMVALRCE